MKKLDKIDLFTRHCENRQQAIRKAKAIVDEDVIKVGSSVKIFNDSYDFSILHDQFAFIEQYDKYDSVLMKSLDAIKISTLYYVKCGSPCNYSEVKSTIITKSRYIPPDVYDEISTPLFEYPSQFFADYLTLEELYQFLVLYDEFESIKWRGKIYNTEELRKLYEK